MAELTIQTSDELAQSLEPLQNRLLKYHQSAQLNEICSL